MFKKAMIGGGLLLATGALTATTTLYITESNKFEEKLINSYMNKIVGQLNGLEEFDHKETKVSLSELKQEIENKIKEHKEKNLSKHEIFREVVNDEIKKKLNRIKEESVENLKNNPTHAGLNALITLYENEVNDSFQETINLYENGYVGAHDLNYYSTAFKNVVHNTDFQIVKNTLDVRKEEVANNKTNLDKYSEEIQGLLKGLEAATQSLSLTGSSVETLVETKFSDFETKIANLLETIGKNITENEKLTLDESKLNTTSALKPLLESFNELKDGYYAFKSIVDGFITIQKDLATSHKSKIEVMTAFVNNSTTSLIAIIDAVDKLKSETETLSKNQTEKTEKLKEIEEAIGTFEATSSNNLSEHIASMALVLTNLNSLNSTNTLDLTSLKAKLLEIQNKNNNQSTKVVDLKTIQELLQSQNGGLSEKMNLLDKKVDDLKVIVTALKVESDNNSSIQTGLKTTLDSLEASLATIEANKPNAVHVVDNSDSITALTALLATLQTNQDALNTRLLSLKSTIDTYSKKLDNISLWIAGIMTTMDNMVKSLADKGLDITSNENYIYATKERINALESNYDTFNKRLTNVENDYGRILTNDYSLLYQSTGKNSGINKQQKLTSVVDLKTRSELTIAYTINGFEQTIKLALNPSNLKTRPSALIYYGGETRTVSGGTTWWRWRIDINLSVNSINFYKLEWSNGWGWYGTGLKIHQVYSER
ncbi:hypothetical protein [Mycoplasma todarodis]|uniref:Uncharacterized protein n=1 Tax=Mycoplasma todarodis TaxID=1937191 RepID=A0A4V2NHZ3_9MOLU|nr:hypothetical protein [Mycoplasma todarodis]TCG10698.1 hypothetical protein C4B25_03240 [Mycoplasma todarodis]